MSPSAFEQGLAELKNKAVTVDVDDIPDSRGTASIIVNFAGGAALKAGYWRLIQVGQSQISSFDHQQRYGLSAPFDAKEILSRALTRTFCESVTYDGETSDLILLFDNNTRLQVFGFTAYEMWEMNFPDGSVEYSNHLGE
jgi:hypothetical protein